MTRVAVVWRSAPWTSSADALLVTSASSAIGITARASTGDGVVRRSRLSTRIAALAATRRTALTSAPSASIR